MEMLSAQIALCFNQTVDSLLTVRHQACEEGVVHFCQRIWGLEEQVGITLPGTQELPLGWPSCSLQSSETHEPTLETGEAC